VARGRDRAAEEAGRYEQQAGAQALVQQVEPDKRNVAKHVRGASVATLVLLPRQRIVCATGCAGLREGMKLQETLPSRHACNRSNKYMWCQKVHIPEVPGVPPQLQPPIGVHQRRRRCSSKVAAEYGQ